jgi:hypothetical protein
MEGGYLMFKLFRRRLKTSKEKIDEKNKQQEKYDQIIEDKEREYKFKNRLHLLRFPTYTKNLVAVIILVCLIDLQLSFILAFMGKDTCTELNIKLCETILAVACAYIFRAYFDNRAERAARGEIVSPTMAETLINNAKERIANIAGTSTTNTKDKDNQPMMSGNEEFFKEFTEESSNVTTENVVPTEEEEFK